jgi:pSer/pThr/pTyr-binding forkhead associated (FHA) protein
MPSGPYRVDSPHPTLSDDSAVPAVYRLLVGRQAIRIEPGATLLGRGEECAIIVMHSTVSRRHARVVFEEGSLGIEDLGSANGTYVNKARIFGRVPLKRGDWIALGGFEIEVLQSAPEPAADEDEDRPTPVSGVELLDKVPTSAGEMHTIQTDRSPRTEGARLEEFESAGRLADRMFAAGRAEAAEQILGEPILRILSAARAGNLPTTPIVDALGRYALRLANATGDVLWADAAVEVHLLAARPFRIETLRQVAALRSRKPGGDDALIARYYETLRSKLASMNAEERILVTLVSDLVPGLDRSR